MAVPKTTMLDMFLLAQGSQLLLSLGWEVLAGLREAEQLLRAVPRVDGLPAQADEPARPHVAARFSAPMTFISTDTGQEPLSKRMLAGRNALSGQRAVCPRSIG